MIRTKSQLYSDVVFGKVNALVSRYGEDTSIKRYKALSKRSGGILRTVGLIQFLSFLAAKASKNGEVHHEFLLEHLQEELRALNIIESDSTAKLLKIIRKQELPEYMVTTSEVLKLLRWHKQISDILISGNAEED